MVRVDGWLDGEAGDFFSQVLAYFTPKPPSAEQLLADPSAFEPVGWRRVQALIQMCHHAMAHAQGCNGEGGGRNTMIVGVGLDVLTKGVGTGSIASQVAGGSILSAAALRRRACDANIIPAVLGTQSELLDLGRQTRLVSPGLRAAIVLRDGGCVFAGCDRPPSWRQVHHRHHWANGGGTDRCNLDLLCDRHHHLVHEGGWTITIGNDPARTPYFHPPRRKAPQRPTPTTRPTPPTNMIADLIGEAVGTAARWLGSRV